MKQTRIHLEWSESPSRQFRTGVSLHSHTLHSRETLDFIYRWARRSASVRLLLRRGESHYRKRYGHPLDLRRAWWTPPCAPYDAWRIERNQIEQRLQLNSLISLTDHDSVEGPLGLRALESCRGMPVSVEWTVPWGCTFFHIGVHNIRADKAREIFTRMTQVTEQSRSASLMDVLHSLSNDPGTLVVFNHPCWDEERIGMERHLELVASFLRICGEFIHALELNGLRPWRENLRVLQVAHSAGKPVISGGDRHALEANAILDLTSALTFNEYADQVRSGWTNVLVTNSYRESFGLRILRSVEEVLRIHEEHGRGWRRWSDRVFYRCDDGIVRPLGELLPSEVLGFVQLIVNKVGVLRHCGLDQTCRLILPRQKEFAL